MILAEVARLRLRLPFTTRSNEMQPHPYLVETRAALDSIKQYLAVVEARLDALAALPTPAPIPTTDEFIAAASSATAVYKALEPELGIDRRTILAKVERLVLAHKLQERVPDWSTNVTLARYFAERVDGKRRLVSMLEALA